MEFVSKSLADTENIASYFLNKLETKRDSATLVGLYGDLGSGKTTFTKYLAKHLGVNEDLASPTFIIIKKYPLTHKAFKYFFHIDAYRLESHSELLRLDWQKLVADKNNLIVLEWPERVSEIILPNTEKIIFEFLDESSRKITIFNK
jgi:tRNA threonylcarbamoyladenosine biosynthesis protein TsaE